MIIKFQLKRVRQSIQSSAHLQHSKQCLFCNMQILEYVAKPKIEELTQLFQYILMSV